MNIELSAEVIAGLTALAELLGERPPSADPRDLAILVLLLRQLPNADALFPVSGAHNVLTDLDAALDRWAADIVDQRLSDRTRFDP